MSVRNSAIPIEQISKLGNLTKVLKEHHFGILFTNLKPMIRSSFTVQDEKITS